MRFFIALEIPDENRPQFQAIQNRLHKFLPQAKLTDPEKIHLTLAFIGEQPDNLQHNLTEAITQATLNVPPFEVTPAYIDGFPNLHHPNVLWVGVKGDIDKVLLIREGIKDGLENLHLPVDERRFVPHITIAKFKNDIHIDRDLEVKLEQIMTSPDLIGIEPIKITSIKLFESSPREGFHTHNTLAEIHLSP